MEEDTTRLRCKAESGSQLPETCCGAHDPLDEVRSVNFIWNGHVESWGMAKPQLKQTGPAKC